MREIKFRAWDKPTKSMFENHTIHFEPENWAIIRKSYKINIAETDSLNGVLMQYTGRKDVNGKEVYEDDIIRVENLGYDPSNGETPYLLLRVTYSELETAFMAARSDFLSEYADMDIQVIGNAHEHPELL